MKQAALFARGKNHLELAFEKFDAANPSVWVHFIVFARQARAVRHHYSARDIVHRIRWHLDIETKSEDGFKINNNHSPYYARKLVREDPSFAGFFEMRCVKGDDP